MNHSQTNRRALRRLNRIGAGILMWVGIAGQGAIAADELGYNAPTQGSHVMSLAVDRAGSVWVGDQDWAVWNRTVDAAGRASWRQYTVKDGLGDNDAYAVAGDKQGRVWVGHLNHGVSVWNGQSWKNYGAFDGPPGERVFDIAVCPTDGDVWIATEAGLGRYSALLDKWTYFSRADGMSSDQVSGIAFDKAGNIYCSTPAEGITFARAAGGYGDWTAVRAGTIMPNRASGAGLPSNIVNDILVARGTPDGAGAGFIYAATDNGLAWSRDAGKSWEFVRGADWRDNIAGRTKKVAVVEVPIDEDELLLQDWSTCLAENRSGMIWVGHRRKGFEARDPRTMRATFTSSDKPLVEGDEDYVRAMLDAPGVGFLVARYGNPSNPGVMSLGKGAFSPDETLAPNAETTVPPFPSPAAPLSAAQLNALRARISKLTVPLKPGDGAFLGDDWATQGDWVGRYGRGHATLAAMDGGSREQFNRLSREKTDHVLVGAPGYDANAQNGPHLKTGLEPWVTWANPDTSRALYDPLVGHRRHAEWTDISNFLNLYPWAWEGPDVWVTVKVPAGMHRASLYFFNKDGQNGQNRFRDFPIELKRAPEGATDFDTATVPMSNMQRVGLTATEATRAKTVLAEVDATPTIARARVTDFWGSVYKQFALCGPATFYFKVARNHSYGVIVSGVFLDSMTDPKAPAPKTKPLSWMNGVTYDAPAIEEPIPYVGPVDPSADLANAKNAQTLAAARALWTALDATAWKKSGLGLQRPMRLQAFRAAIASGASPSLLANWRWKLGLWNEADHAEWRETMKRAFPVK